MMCITQGLFDLPGFSYDVREGAGCGLKAGPPHQLGYNIGVAVSIHVNGEIAKVFQVTSGVLSTESKKRDIAKVVFDPARPILTRRRLFVPAVAGDNVEFPVAIHIGDLCRFALSQINGVLIEGNFGEPCALARSLIQNRKEDERVSGQKDEDSAGPGRIEIDCGQGRY